MNTDKNEGPTNQQEITEETEKAENRHSPLFSLFAPVQSDGLSASRGDTFRRAFAFPGVSGDFRVPYFLVILLFRPSSLLRSASYGRHFSVLFFAPWRLCVRAISSGQRLLCSLRLAHALGERRREASSIGRRGLLSARSRLT